MAVDFYINPDPLNACNTGGAGYTYRMLFPPSKLLVDVVSAIIEFGYYSGCACNINEMWIGQSGAILHDFDGNQKQVLKGGSPSFLLNADGLLSDEVAVSLSKSKSVLLSWYQAADGHQGISYSNVVYAEYDLYYKSGNLAGVTLFTGCGVSGKTDRVSLVNKITGGTSCKLLGTVKEKGSPVIRTVRSYIRSTGVLYAIGASEADGSFSIDAPDSITEMFVVAFDDDAGDQYNALIFDRVKGVEI